MTSEDIYEHLETIIERYKMATKDTFETESKNGKKLYRSILNLMDELEYCKPSDELFDEDEFFEREERTEFESEDSTEEDSFYPKKLKKEDLLGSDDDVDFDW
jgi:hypothetical protein